MDAFDGGAITLNCGVVLLAATDIRLKLLKIGALVAIRVRRGRLAFASACPGGGLFELAAWRL